MHEEEIQPRTDALRKKAMERLRYVDPALITYLRVDNRRQLSRLAFEDRLSPEDRELLRAMDIAL